MAAKRKKTGPKKVLRTVTPKKPTYAKLPGVADPMASLWPTIETLIEAAGEARDRHDSIIYSLNNLSTEVKNLRIQVMTLRDVIQEMADQQADQQAAQKAKATAEKLLAKPHRRIRKLGPEMTAAE